MARMPTPGVKERGAIFSGDMSRDPQTSTELARGETSLLLLSPVPDHTRLISRQLITSGIFFAFSTRPSVPGPHLQHGNQRNHIIDLNLLPAQATCTRPAAKRPPPSSLVLALARNVLFPPLAHHHDTFSETDVISPETDDNFGENRQADSVHRPCDQGQ